MRNTIFVGIATNIATSIGCDNIIIGTVKAHKSIGYTNDGFQHWFKDMTNIISHTTNCTLLSPSSTKTFEDICKYLSEKADISHLWMCEDNFKLPCSSCNKCKAFKKESVGKYSKKLYSLLYEQR